MSIFDYIRRFLNRSTKQRQERQVAEFQRKFGIIFINSELLAEALTHRSYMKNCRNDVMSNERLEFLGDSVLGLVTSEYLFKVHSDYNEGDLTKTKALLVNEQTLSLVGRDSGINEFIYLSPDEEKTGGRERPSIISDCVEAIIGAIFLDQGLQSARKFVNQILFSRSDMILSDSSMRNYKGELLEYLQSKGIDPPQYEVVSEEGPDHEKTFKVVVYTQGEVTGYGKGLSKKDAEQKAAADSLKCLFEKEKETSKKQC